MLSWTGWALQPMGSHYGYPHSEEMVLKPKESQDHDVTCLDRQVLDIHYQGLGYPCANSYKLRQTPC